MKIRRLLGTGAVVTMLFTLSSAPVFSAEATPDAAILKACTVCHGAPKICAQIGKKDEAQWKATIERMVKKGAELPADQQAAAAKYLADPKAASGPVCGKK
ncbi:hypothetical protein [Desulfatirhabdium butyrativorans]|uniref:hypothetical protein n=1 Tax=Desulfatirhabdium butyrativorans TaxID=340467 RepID=UPI00041044B7|nr:hypothetical protein [Desulfatirhabdium butyrativorans]